ncbi:MAG: nucleoid-associated protein [Acidobacteriota bacterium]|jgi:hypothetical protein|nr:nucleoid-associated protein [Acidobacteriota bacterium]
MINNAILHILDFNSGVTVFSEKELEIGNEVVNSFLSKHIERALLDANLKSGTFSNNSSFKNKIANLLTDKTSFIEISTAISQEVLNIISNSDIQNGIDIMICTFSIDDSVFFGIWLFSNKVAFTHQVGKEKAKIKNDIIKHCAILPSPSQKTDSLAIIDLKSFDVKFSDKKRMVDGKDCLILPELILNCSVGISPSDVKKIVSSVALDVAEKHGYNTAITVSKAKNYLLENSEVSDWLESSDLGREIFSDSKSVQNEFSNKMKSQGVADNIRLDRNIISKSSKTHKIKTDTGIEISVPVEYFQNRDYIDFFNNPDGTISIELKNIGKIINKY